MPPTSLPDHWPDLPPGHFPDDQDAADPDPLAASASPATEEANDFFGPRQPYTALVEDALDTLGLVWGRLSEAQVEIFIESGHYPGLLADLKIWLWLLYTGSIGDDHAERETDRRALLAIRSPAAARRASAENGEQKGVTSEALRTGHPRPAALLRDLIKTLALVSRSRSRPSDPGEDAGNFPSP